MHRKIIITAFLIAFMPAVAAQTTGEIESDPGMIAPGGAAYGLEVAVENTAANVGLINKQEMMQERAREAKWAKENGDVGVQARANKALGQAVSKVATEDNTIGTEKAQEILSTLKQNGVSVTAGEQALANAGGLGQNAPDNLEAPPQGTTEGLPGGI